jgi:Flp pilus assembly protein TadD
LPLAFTGLERINDFSGALEVANELVEAVPANGTFRYWRALAYDRTGKFSQAMLDYMNAIQLAGDPKQVKSESCWIFSPGPHPLKAVF